jgi:hypothetical protein
MTSGEHPGWHTPRVVRIDETGAGPNPDRTYVQVTVLSDDPVDGASRLVIADRFDSQWRRPEPGRRREVAVWRLDRPGVTWTDHSFHTESLNPEAWCTVCATRAEADNIADGVQRWLDGSGW